MGSARGCSLIPHLNWVNPDAFDSEGFRAKTQAEDSLGVPCPGVNPNSLDIVMVNWV